MAVAFAQAGLQLGLEFLRSRQTRKSLESQARTTLFNAQALRAEAEEAGIAAEFDIERLKEAGALDIAEIEAQLAEAGQGSLETTTQANLLNAAAEVRLAALIRKREGAFAKAQGIRQAQSEERKARDLKKASKRTFLGLF